MRTLVLIVILFVASSGIITAQPEIIINCDNSFGPGRFNKVHATLKFESSTGFARFSQDFPEGFEVRADSISNGDFSWNGNRIDIVYLKIPKEKIITFSYSVKPAPDQNGEFRLSSKLVHVPDRISRSITETNSADIRIGGTNGILPGPSETEIRQQNVTNVTNRPKVNAGNQSQAPQFRVQIFSSSSQYNAVKIRNDYKLGAEVKVNIIRSSNMYKYQAGEFPDYESASGLLKKIRSGGATDAFIVAYSGTKQISVAAARESPSKKN